MNYKGTTKKIQDENDYEYIQEQYLRYSKNRFIIPCRDKKNDDSCFKSKRLEDKLFDRI